MEREEWRPVKEYEGKYEVSSNGSVKSINYHRSGKERILKGLGNNGYLRVDFYDNGKRKHYLIHDLVAIAFPKICGEWFEGCEVDHINGIKTDNRANNLRVVNHSTNCQNPITSKRQIEGCSTDKERKRRSDRMKGNMIYTSNDWWKKRTAVAHYDKGDNLIEQYGGKREAARETGIGRSTLSYHIKHNIIEEDGSYWKCI